MLSDLWKNRAKECALAQPSDCLSVLTSNIDIFLGKLRCGNTSVSLYAANVPGVGNCLYHAVWRSAQFLNIVSPMGFNGSDHVFSLRASVGATLLNLFQNGIVENWSGEDYKDVCELVTKPNQYLRYSGLMPMLAMAYMLRRRIVLLNSDGISHILPFPNGMYGDVDINDEEYVAIYHCRADNIGRKVPFDQRNHYIPVKFLAERHEKAFRDIIARYRSGEMPIWSAEGTIHTPTRSNKRIFAEMASDELESKFEDETHHGHTVGDTDNSALKDLIDKAYNLSSVDDKDLCLLRANYTRHPNLALLYYQCCSNHPESYVCNDESLLDDTSGATRHRLNSVLDKPVSSEDVANCQSQCEKNGLGDIWACASCCEFVNTADRKISRHRLGNLHPGFKLTTAERDIYQKMPNDIVRQHVQCLIIGDVWYHLNPDLVPDISSINICSVCSEDPRQSQFSIASGHDYGRYATLPALNDVALNCICPVRCFGLEISISRKHTMGHSICFPSDGPQKCSVLPNVDEHISPRVTFIGPSEQWRREKNKYKFLYHLPIEDIYKWLYVLCHTHQYYKDHGIKIDESSQRVEQLHKLDHSIQENVVISESESVAEVNERVTEERFGTDYDEESTSDGFSFILKKSAVLKKPNSCEPYVTNAAVDAMLDVINPPKDKEPVVVIRDSNPVIEWFQNGEMIAASFPNLFLCGAVHLPNGTWPVKLIKHLMNYYDGRFEKNTKFVATLFSQLQRHTSVKKAAKIGSSKAKILTKLGALANCNDFRERLRQAKIAPETRQAKQLNASLQRLLSLVGGCVPFSIFERIGTRPKLAGLRYRYGVPMHWVTIAPPEHDDLELHRIAMLRKTNDWNKIDSMYSLRSCSFSDLE